MPTGRPSRSRRGSWVSGESWPAGGPRFRDAGEVAGCGPDDWVMTDVRARPGPGAARVRAVHGRAARGIRARRESSLAREPADATRTRGRRPAPRTSTRWITSTTRPTSTGSKRRSWRCPAAAGMPREVPRTVRRRLCPAGLAGRPDRARGVASRRRLDVRLVHGSPARRSRALAQPPEEPRVRGAAAHLPVASLRRAAASPTRPHPHRTAPLAGSNRYLWVMPEWDVTRCTGAGRWGTSAGGRPR